MKFPFYRQPDSVDCGPTCLQMISSYYGKRVSLQLVRERSQLGKEGVSLLGISEAAEKMGFRTQAVKLSYDALCKDVLLPCILHWNRNHFVVLYRLRKTKLYIADPAHGLSRFKKEEFLQRWLSGMEEGIALMLEPTAKFYEEIKEEQRPVVKSVFTYLLPYKKLILQLFLGLFISSILQLALPFLAQSVVDVGINTANIHFIYLVLIAQVALIIGRLSVDLIRSWLLLHISTRINIAILTGFLIKLMRLPMPFFDTRKTGDILQRMSDYQRIESFLTGSSITVLFSLTNLAIFSVVLAVYNIHIFFVFAVASLFYSLWVILFLKTKRKLDYKSFDIAARGQSSAVQLVQGMQEVKLNGVEKPMRWTWERLQAKSFKLKMKMLTLNQWQQSGASLINEGKNVFITFLSAEAVINGQMTLGSMLAIQYIIGQLNSPIDQMLNFIGGWQQAKISMERLNEVHRMEDEEPPHRHFLQELPPAFTRQIAGGNAIVFSNVSFTYPGAGNEPVLKDINLKIPKGKTTAMVGVSGSGKTTLLKLLLKFYEPQKGEIFLGLAGPTLSTISHKMWRARCGAVMQDSFIFSASIARNIALGEDEPDMEKLKHSVNVANIGEFIDSLPMGLNTTIGAEGTGISMGQRQRILIARTVYRDPDFIFLDEATNSLDANNENTIVQNLRSFLESKTVVVVAHRLSTVRHADQIIVLNDGVIAERGTHQELVNLKGIYFTLVRNQLELGE